MSTPAVSTVIKMIESLPEDEQDRVVDHLREYIFDLEDELEWDQQFRETQNQLVAAAKKAREQVAKGEAKPLNTNDL
ncbi:MAG: hypothetical protein M1339_01990 [Bacteroidetes bacterium]|nr:hypothetical protein [Bacteroidota bacterium]